MSFYSPSLPLKRGIEDTYEKNKTIEQQVNFYIKNLLLTSPGENISDPLYGVGLYSFLFEPATESTTSFITSKISSQISSYIPYINVSNISIDDSTGDFESNLINIKISYNIVEDVETLLFNLEVNNRSTIGLY